LFFRVVGKTSKHFMKIPHPLNLVWQFQYKKS
jgi:hypothetical protein